MKILSREQCYEADKRTLEAQGIGSVQLMERAAVAVFNWLHQRLQGAPVRIHIFCGTGNNGGDGLSVARHLADHGYHIGVYVVRYREKCSEDFMENLDRLKERKVWPETLVPDSEWPEISPADIVLDAIFGIGLSRPPDPWVRAGIARLNASGAFLLSVDMPSGLPMDALPEFPEGVVRADFVLAIGTPKLVFFLPQTGIYARDFSVLDIGFDSGYLVAVQTSFEWVTKAEARLLYRPRDKFTHKGDYGHACIAGGSYGKIGAVALAARACLYAGAGLVSAWTPRCGYVPLQTGLPEVMLQTAPGELQLDAFPDPEAGYCFGVGMGMGTDAVTAAAFTKWLARLKAPLVVDADGLNVLSQHPEALDSLPEGSILTPHPGELRRLIGPWEDDFEKLDKAREFARSRKCVLLVKGAHTLVLQGDRGYVNCSGNPGMATAGSGDVLCGMITGLLTQGYPPLEAAVLAVHLHGRAGDLMAVDYGQEALTAGRIAEGIGRAFTDLAQVATGAEAQQGSGEEPEST